MSNLKECRICKLKKSLSDFGKNRSRKDGIRSECKECHSVEVLAYQKTKTGRENKIKNNKKYQHTHKGIASIKKYKAGETGRLSKKRYNQSANGRAACLRWRANRLLRMATVPNTLTKIEWQQIIKDQGNRCAACREIFIGNDPLKRAQKDHIIPLFEGGGTTFENIQALCKPCNSRKGIKVAISA